MRSVAQTPGSGGSVTAFVQPLQAPPSPLEQNPAWQEVNRRLGAEFRFNMVPVADYRAKLTTLMAGSDLPDMINVFRGIDGIANLPPFLSSQCADLSPYLAGAASSDYPNLAAIPTFAWRDSGSVIDGHIFMVPVERYAPGTLMLKNASIYDAEIGTNYVPQDAEDFKRVLQQLNRPSEGRYATGAYQGVAFNINYYGVAFGAPNNWKVERDGKFTRAFETAEYQAATAYTRDLVALGVYHPTRSPTPASSKAKPTLWQASWRSLSLRLATPGTMSGDRPVPLSTPFEILFVPPFPATSGGKAAHIFNLGFQSATALKKAPPDGQGATAHPGLSGSPVRQPGRSAVDRGNRWNRLCAGPERQSCSYRPRRDGCRPGSVEIRHAAATGDVSAEYSKLCEDAVRRGAHAYSDRTRGSFTRAVFAHGERKGRCCRPRVV